MSIINILSIFAKLINGPQLRRLLFCQVDVMEDKSVINFPKKERLHSNKLIESLFSKGKSFIVYPLRVVYLIGDENDSGNQLASVLVSVSKRKFKRAVKRNRVKRLIKENYRLNKKEIVESLKANNKSVSIALIYLKDTLPEYSEIEKSVIKVIQILSGKIGGERDEKDSI